MKAKVVLENSKLTPGLLVSFDNPYQQTSFLKVFQPHFREPRYLHTVALLV